VPLKNPTGHPSKELDMHYIHRLGRSLAVAGTVLFIVAGAVFAHDALTATPVRSTGIPSTSAPDVVASEAGDQTDQQGDIQDQAGDQTDQAGDVQDPAGDVQDQAGDQNDQAGDVQDPAGDQADQQGDVQDPAGDVQDQAGDQTDQAGDSGTSSHTESPGSQPKSHEHTGGQGSDAGDGQQGDNSGESGDSNN
jgi:hypothetical protein